MKPLIFYVDDEPMNLTVFEATIPDTWEVKCFDNPVQALSALDELSPVVIVSDQRMPQMSGVQFLELARKIRPNTVRIIVTGFSDEDLVVQSVRKAQIFDYIKKPWDPDDLEASLQRAIDLQQATEASRLLQIELQKREQQLTDQNNHLNQVLLDLEKSKQKESEMRKELECWVPPFVLWAIQQASMTFPIARNITGITFDIINSSQIHDLKIQGRHLRTHIIQLFSESIIRHGGWRESHSGDSAYGHFGLMENEMPPADAALAVAQEFRASLKSISSLHNLSIECGLALHTAQNALVDIHTVQLNTPRGVVTQKSFDTTSSDIDLLHRMEKLAHELPGSNIIMSKEFVDQLKTKPEDIEFLGHYQLRGQKEAVALYMIRSYFAKPEHVEALKKKSVEQSTPEPKSA